MSEEKVYKCFRCKSILVKRKYDVCKRCADIIGAWARGEEWNEAWTIKRNVSEGE